MADVLICSGCDHAYFPLLKEMIHSLRRFEGAKDFKFAVLDTGLFEEDRVWLSRNVDYVHAPDWPALLPAWKIRGREYLKSCVCRPWLPLYFPGHKTYMWIDPDAWVQEWEGVALFLEGARRGKIAVTGQVDRAYPKSVRIKWLGPIPLKLRGFYFSNAKKAFGLDVAKRLYPYHVLLAGTFALAAEAPHWARWREIVLQALRKGKIFTAEQLSLGVLCYLEDYPFEILPAWCHWLCEFLPPFDSARNLFVEPFLPHHPLSILHISGFDDLRRDRRVQIDLRTLSGEFFRGTIRYPDLDGELPDSGTP